MKKTDLTKGNVLKVLTALALPIMGGSLLQFAYNLVDMLWVGRLGTDAVASIGSSSFFIGLGYSINALVVIGGGIKVAHAIGKQDEQETKAYINASLALNAIIGFIYAIILIVLGKNFISFLQLGNMNVEKNAYLYLAYSAPMLFFAFFNILFTRLLGSFGNNKEAFKISAIGIMINIILDPLLIYGLKMGVLGTAVATLIANAVMFFLFLYKGKNLLFFDKKVGIAYEKIKEIIKLGFPMAFQRILFTLVNIVLARIIAVFGSEAIAAQKIGVQIEAVTYMIIGGLNGAVASFTGQNFGAKQYDRIHKGYRTALGIGGIYAFITTIVFLLIPNAIVKLFINEPSTIEIASSYLRIIALSQVFSALEMITNGLFTGIGIPKVSANISIAFTVLRIPMALMLIQIWGINGIWWSITFSSLLKGGVAYLFYKIKVQTRYQNDETNPTSI
ncbi:MATE family efflux transporter [Niameybacter massiliensis]|uniref:Probable multidrug resistance protein NorM n=1 Tax=Holtiella tumoricola TaxID=3018743 RepID=A0AA42DL73_9FIRM|nr:MATE family efflux transporter [Holtiella tumoricola]MDA3731004.1 MATE family efflux transporter [Holtiella tumoricola]